jgi:hypothetical protein
LPVRNPDLVTDVLLAPYVPLPGPVSIGVNAKALSQFMGHSSIKVTFDLYRHLMPGSEREAAGMLDAFLERASSQARLAALPDAA